MTDYPQLSTRLIGETESALGALLAPLLAEAELTFIQWVVLSLDRGWRCEQSRHRPGPTDRRDHERQEG